MKLGKKKERDGMEIINRMDETHDVYEINGMEETIEQNDLNG